MKTLKIVLVVVAAAAGGLAWGTTFNVPADGTLQKVIDRADCVSGDEIVIAAGTYSGLGYVRVNFLNKDSAEVEAKAVLVRSADPDDPAVVAATVIDCQNAAFAFEFRYGETEAVQVAGLTIINGKGGQGGAIYIGNGSSPTITRCVISNCSATLGGAIAVMNGGSAPVIDKCQLTQNSSIVGGGAVYITGGSPVLSNCIINNNAAPCAGAIYSQNPGNPVVSQCTIADNSGGAKGGAMWVYGGSNMTVRGSILWGNTATAAAEMLVGGPGAATVVDLSYCDVQGLNADILVSAPSTLSGVGNIEADPMFAEGTWELTEQSPCVDAGDPAYAAAQGETDFYGNPRVSGQAVDIGAAEYRFVEAMSALAAQVRLWPKVINLRGHQNFLFCTIKVGDRQSEDIDVDSIVLQDQLEPVWVKSFKRVKELVVRFDMESVAAMVMDSSEDTVSLTVKGTLLDGTPFEGSDTLKIYERKQWQWLKRLAEQIRNEHDKDKDANDQGKDDKGLCKKGK